MTSGFSRIAAGRLRKIRSRIFIGLIFSAVASASAQAPNPVAERISTQRDHMTRVSLFTNQAVVVTMGEKGTQTLVRRITLPDDQYMIYLGILVENAALLEEVPTSSSVDTSRSEVQITLHVGPDAPRSLRFSPMTSVSLPLSRIVGVLDDLQNQVLEASPSAEELRTWEPQPDDRVQLFNNKYATVIEVHENGTLILQHEETYIREFVPLGYRDKVILHVVEREP